jgi:hypothetical protein
MTMLHETPTLTAVAPPMLLGNHLKALKLPTFGREYEKVAMESAQDRADYPRYLIAQQYLGCDGRQRRVSCNMVMPGLLLSPGWSRMTIVTARGSIYTITLTGVFWLHGFGGRVPLACRRGIGFWRK